MSLAIFMDHLVFYMSYNFDKLQKNRIIIHRNTQLQHSIRSLLSKNHAVYDVGPDSPYGTYG